QNRNMIVNALARADIAFMVSATLDGSPANNVEKRPSNKKKGAPGGCPTSSLYAEEINSPQSQKLVVGSMVRMYTTAETTKASHPNRLFKRLKCCITESLQIR